MRKLALRVERTRLFAAMVAMTFSLTALLGLLATSPSDGTDTAAREVLPSNSAISAGMLALTSHDPIFIDGDAEFTTANGVTDGSGTASDPYIIEGWEINSFPANGIEIRYTRVHFIVRDCYVHDGTGAVSAAIKVLGCSNGTVRDCTCSDCSWGIHLLGFGDNCLVDNTCTDNWRGISLYGGSGNSLTGNVVSSSTFADGQRGILLEESEGNWLANNTCSMYFWSCIELQDSDGNTLIDNTCTGQMGNSVGIKLWVSDSNNVSRNTCSGHGTGIFVDESASNRFFNNTCSDNAGHGLSINPGYYDPGGNNRIWNNSFEDNNGAVDSYDPNHCQGCDNGDGNWWNSSDGYGNYWSDWTIPDVAPQDGIVDAPYEIEGDAGAKDFYPLTTLGAQDNEPTPPPAEVDVGVRAGDWVKLEYRISNAPSGTSLPSWIMVEFLSVEGTNATVRITMHMADGSEEEATAPISVVSGGEALGLSGFVIPADTCPEDMVCVSGYEDVWITGETTRKYAGASRAVVYASVYGFGFEGDYYWDKQTGVLVEVDGVSSGISVTAVATETNMWDAQSTEFLSNPTVLFALAIAAVAVVVAIAFIVKRKRKAPPEDESPQS